MYFVLFAKTGNYILTILPDKMITVGFENARLASAEKVFERLL